MVRTLISLSEKDKRWLDSYSKRLGQSAAETVREAIRQLRESDIGSKKNEALGLTAGIWRAKGEDTDTYVDRIRSEW